MVGLGAGQKVHWEDERLDPMGRDGVSESWARPFAVHALLITRCMWLRVVRYEKRVQMTTDDDTYIKANLHRCPQ
jgi:hypothetical protein